MFGLPIKAVAAKRHELTPVAANANLPGNLLLEALTCELHWSALQTGGITCIFNALHARGQGSIPNTCRNHFPVETAIVTSAMQARDDFGLPRALSNRIEKWFKSLAFAKQTTFPFLDAQRERASEQVQLRTIAQLTVVWRSLCLEACETVNALEPETRWRIGGSYSENSLLLNRFLKPAASGNYDCVDPYGEVVLPVLPQRRKAKRFALQQTCKIAARGMSMRGFAQDISMYGMGLTCDVNFGLKESVTIELQTGRRFKGVVVWIKNGRLGIQFNAALGRTDPLIFA